MWYNNIRYQSKEKWRRSFLINKNLSLYYWLGKRIGEREAFFVENILRRLSLSSE